MKRLFFLILTTVIAFGMAMAEPYTPDNLPVSTVFTDSLDYKAVSNPDGILTGSEVDYLNSVLYSLRTQHGVQGLVVCVKETDPDDPYTFALAVARKYGVGGKQSRGFILLLSTVSRGYSILTGDAMEKFLTDADCSTIERNTMLPLLKEEKWGEAVCATVNVIAEVCRGEVELNAIGEDDDLDDGDIYAGLLAIGGLFAGFGGLGYYISRKEKECPKCKKHNYGMKKRQVVIKDDNNATLTKHQMERKTKAIAALLAGAEVGNSHSFKKSVTLRDARLVPIEVTDTYTCPDCKYVKTNKYVTTADKYYIGDFDGTGKYKWGDIAAAAAAAASSDYGFGGGSSGGGSSYHSTFGGGSFSGGGASGRF